MNKRCRDTESAPGREVRLRPAPAGGWYPTSGTPVGRPAGIIVDDVSTRMRGIHTGVYVDCVSRPTQAPVSSGCATAAFCQSHLGPGRSRKPLFLLMKLILFMTVPNCTRARGCRGAGPGDPNLPRRTAPEKANVPERGGDT